MGGHINTYLLMELEKSGITLQNASERSYHIFYRLIAGADEKLRREIGMCEIKDYKVRDRA